MIFFCQVLPSEANPECLQHLRRSSLWQQFTLKAILATTLVAQSSFLDGSRNLDTSLLKHFIITIVRQIKSYFAKYRNQKRIWDVCNI